MYNQINSYDELYHHGVKGMKWGVRRYQNKDGTLTSAGKKHYNKVENKEIKKARKQDVKNRRKLSDADLKKKIERLQTEKKFKDLTNDDISPGKTMASNILRSAGTKVLTAAVAGATAYAVKAAMTKKFDLAEAAKYVAPNPNVKKK